MITHPELNKLWMEGIILIMIFFIIHDYKSEIDKNRSQLGDFIRHRKMFMDIMNVNFWKIDVIPEAANKAYPRDIKVLQYIYTFKDEPGFNSGTYMKFTLALETSTPEPIETSNEAH